jgi:hypothetical protein
MNRRSRRTRSAGHFKNKTKKSASSAFFSRRWFRTDFTQDCFPQIYADEPQISQNTLGWAFQKQNKKIRVIRVLFPQMVSHRFYTGLFPADLRR